MTCGLVSGQCPINASLSCYLFAYQRALTKILGPFGECPWLCFLQCVPLALVVLCWWLFVRLNK